MAKLSKDEAVAAKVTLGLVQVALDHANRNPRSRDAQEFANKAIEIGDQARALLREQ